MSKTDPNPKKTNANANAPAPAPKANVPQPANPAQPKPSGSGQGGSAWVLAILALIVAVAGVSAVIMRSTQSPAPVASASEELDDTALEADSELAEDGSRSGSGSEVEEAEAAEETAVAEAKPAASRAPSTGTLVVSSDVEGADVLLNGKRVGTTPHQATGLKPGSYDVRVEKKGFEPYQEKIQVTAKRHEISAKLTAAAPRLEVASNVSGARVFVDGEERGTTPLSLDDLPPGRHELRVSAAGYRTYTETLELVGGKREVSIDLVSPLDGLNEAVAVKHKHRLGSCEGVLRATSTGIVYESEHKDAFSVELGNVAEIELNGDDLGLKVDGGRNYNFEERNENPDALAGFFERVHDAVEVSRASN